VDEALVEEAATAEDGEATVDERTLAIMAGGEPVDVSSPDLDPEVAQRIMEMSEGAGSPTAEAPHVVEDLPRGRVEVLAVEHAGGAGTFDLAIVQRILRVRMNAIRHCHERHLRDDPGSAPTVEVEMTVQEDGRVAVGARASTPHDEVMESCVAGVLMRFRFDPGATGGPAAFRVRLRFVIERS
jgi:hypothetical protein